MPFIKGGFLLRGWPFIADLRVVALCQFNFPRGKPYETHKMYSRSLQVDEFGQIQNILIQSTLAVALVVLLVGSICFKKKSKFGLDNN